MIRPARLTAIITATAVLAVCGTVLNFGTAAGGHRMEFA